LSLKTGAAWLMGSGKIEGTHVLFLSLSFISTHEAVSRSRVRRPQ
jgi:hypothetical protein